MNKVLFIALLVLFVSCSEKSQDNQNNQEVKEMKISSPAFENEGMIPSKFTCDGENISPELIFENIPDSAISLALIMDDPDAPRGTWVHWVIFNIPVNTKRLRENFPKADKIDDGTIQGLNSWPEIGYGGPCPPSGVHRYYFKLYALDKKLDLTSNATKEDLLTAMEGHIIAEAQIMGKYTKRK